LNEISTTAEAPQTVLVTGGGGYVGAVLVPKLLARGHRVRVLDLFWFGQDVLDEVAGHPGLTLLGGDIRDQALLRRALARCDAVIHLACVSNDPSFELHPALGKSINYDAFAPLCDLARDAGVRRFVYASSSSVYGVKATENVTEDLPLAPLTDYSRYKAACEEILLGKRAPGVAVLVVRPATVCGYSPRLRLDLTVNILTSHAIHNRRIKVLGGAQMRPNIHIDDMTDLYVQALDWPAAAIDGKVYNVGYQNHRVSEIAEIVRGVVSAEIAAEVAIETQPTDDNRSYHISSEKIRRELGFQPARALEDAVADLCAAFRAGRVPDAMTGDRYYNIRTMQRCAV
jgi:nucleoside-diphosphate-sugar epimerase